MSAADKHEALLRRVVAWRAGECFAPDGLDELDAIVADIEASVRPVPPASAPAALAPRQQEP